MKKKWTLMLPVLGLLLAAGCASDRDEEEFTTDTVSTTDSGTYRDTARPMTDTTDRAGMGGGWTADNNRGTGDDMAAGFSL